MMTTPAVAAAQRTECDYERGALNSSESLRGMSGKLTPRPPANTTVRSKRPQPRQLSLTPVRQEHAGLHWCANVAPPAPALPKPVSSVATSEEGPNHRRRGTSQRSERQQQQPQQQRRCCNESRASPPPMEKHPSLRQCDWCGELNTKDHAQHCRLRQIFCRFCGSTLAASMQHTHEATCTKRPTAGGASDVAPPTRGGVDQVAGRTCSADVRASSRAP